MSFSTLLNCRKRQFSKSIICTPIEGRASPDQNCFSTQMKTIVALDPKGAANIKNWLWNGTMGAIEHGGRIAGIVVAAVAINTALESSLDAAETARSYGRNIQSGESAWADLDA